MKVDNSIETTRFFLTSLDPSFVGESYKSWLIDPEVNQYLETRFMDQSDEELVSYVSQLLISEHSFLFAVVSKETGTHIGNIKLGPINKVHSSAPIGLVIGDRNWWGKGVAKEIISALSDWGFNELKLAKINAGSYASNQGSVRAFLSCGFSEEGKQLAQVELRPGVRDDVILLGKVNPELLAENR